MNRRLIAAVSTVLAFSVGMMSAAPPAYAQEVRVTSLASPMTMLTPDGSPAIRHSLAVARMHAEQAMPFELDPPMKEVRLSSGAKTAIIVTAIVVGALIIVGAVALSRGPGKKLP